MPREPRGATRTTGVDRALFLTTIRPLRTGPGLRHHLFLPPVVLAPLADLPPQPPAGARTCRDRLGLRGRRTAWHPEPSDQRVARRSGDCAGGGPPADAHAAGPKARGCNADRRRARGGDRSEGGRRAVSMGRRLARRWVRLLRARLLGLRATRYRTAAQLVRAL